MYKVFSLVVLVVLLSACFNKKQAPTLITTTEDIILGDFNTYGLSKLEYSKHYMLGWKLAAEEINAKGGINGRKLKIVSANDFGSFIGAYGSAKEIDQKNKILAFFGTFINTSAEGIAKYSHENKIPFLVTGSYSDKIIFDNPSDFVFRLRPGIHSMFNYMTDKIANSKMSSIWQVITYSNEEGEYISKTFKILLSTKNTNVKFLEDIYVSGAFPNSYDVIKKAENSMATNILIAIPGNDLERFIFTGKQKNLLKRKRVFILFAGEPEWLTYLGEYTPNNWYTLGYPWYAIETPIHREFYNKYTKKYVLKPRYASILGYVSVYMLAEAIKKVGSTGDLAQDRELIAKALENLEVDTPLGRIKMRKDHQSTIPLYAGYINKVQIEKVRLSGNRKIIIVDVRMQDPQFIDFNKYLLNEGQSLKIRTINQKNNIKKQEKFRKLMDDLDRKKNRNY